MIGMGGINEGYIAEDAINRALSCLGRFKLSCDKYLVEEIRAIGTSAIRDAKNSHEFIQRVKAKVSIEIKTVDGQQEANLIYHGIAYKHIFTKPSLIMDIGGGSTEFIFADHEGIIEKKSFNIGISRIYQLFDLSDPLTSDDILKIERYLDESTGDFFEKINTDVLIVDCFMSVIIHNIHKTLFNDFGFIKKEGTTGLMPDVTSVQPTFRRLC